MKCLIAYQLGLDPGAPINEGNGDIYYNTALMKSSKS